MIHAADQSNAKKHAAWDDRLDQMQHEIIPTRIGTPRGVPRTLLGSSLLFGSFQSEPPLAAPGPPIHDQEIPRKADLVQYASITTATDIGWQVKHYRPKTCEPQLCKLDFLPSELQMLILGSAPDFPTFINLTQSTSRLMAVYNEYRGMLHAKVMLRMLKDKGIDPHRPTTWLEVSVWPQGINKTIHDIERTTLRFIPTRAEFEERGLSLETTIQDIYVQTATNNPVSLTPSQCWLLGYIDQAVGYYTSSSSNGAPEPWCTGSFSEPVSPSNPDTFMTLCFGTRTADDLKMLKCKLRARIEVSEGVAATI